MGIREVLQEWERYKTSGGFGGECDASNAVEDAIDEALREDNRHHELEGGCWLAVAPYRWGRGKTVKEAIANLKAEGGRWKKGERILYWCSDPTAFLNDMGAVTFEVGSKYLIVLNPENEW